MSKHVFRSLLTLSWVIGLCGWGVPAPALESAPDAPSAVRQAVADQAGSPETPVFLEDTSGFDSRFRDDPGMGRLAGHALASLLVVVAVAVVSLLIARRFMSTGSARRRGKALAVLETSVIGPKKALHVVRVGARTYLVASGVEDVRLLADVTDDVDVAEEEISTDEDRHETSFTGVLRKIVGSRIK